MLDFVIRRFEPNDQQQVEHLVLTIQQDEFQSQLSTQNQPDLKDVASFFNDGHSAFWVAQGADSQIIGSVGLMDLGNGACAMRKFMVAAHARGRENGVSAALTATFEDYARLNCPLVALSTIAVTAAAQKFYVREGYQIVDQAKMPEGFVPGPLDVVFMLKTLSQNPAQ